MIIAGEVSIFVIFLLQFSHIYFKTTFLVPHVSMVTHLSFISQLPFLLC